MTGPRTRVPGSASPCAGRSSSTSVAGSGLTPASRRAPGSVSPCPHCPTQCRPIKGRPMANRDGVEPVDVLLVEDDEGDVLLTREAFEFYKIRNTLHVVTDG